MYAPVFLPIDAVRKVDPPKHWEPSDNLPQNLMCTPLFLPIERLQKVALRVLGRRPRIDPRARSRVEPLKPVEPCKTTGSVPHEGVLERADMTPSCHS